MTAVVRNSGLATTFQILAAPPPKKPPEPLRHKPDIRARLTVQKERQTLVRVRFHAAEHDDGESLR